MIEAHPQIGVAPATIFSAKQKYQNFIRLNRGNPWSDKIEEAIRRLGQIIARQSA